MIKRLVRQKLYLLAFFVTCLLAPATSHSSDSWYFGGNYCRSHLAGTYLTTILDSHGKFSSRSVLTVHRDGSLSTTDSNQFELKFGQQQGTYRCHGKSRAKGITLNFGETEAPGEINIARSNWMFKKKKNGNLAGEITVNLFTPLEDCNPLNDADQTCTVDPIGTFRFTGVRVNP